MNADIYPISTSPRWVFAEAEGFAPEEVERLILAPLEAAVLGSPNVDWYAARPVLPCHCERRIYLGH